MNEHKGYNLQVQYFRTHPADFILFFRTSATAVSTAHAADTYDSQHVKSQSRTGIQQSVGNQILQRGWVGRFEVLTALMEIQAHLPRALCHRTGTVQQFAATQCSILRVTSAWTVLF